MPSICVSCGQPSEQFQNHIVSQIFEKNKIRTTLKLAFPLCHDCGLVLAKYRKSDTISGWIAAGLGFLPAILMAYLSIQSHENLSIIILPPLIIFGLFFFILRFIIKPISRLFIPAKDKSIYRQIKKSVKINSFDQFVVNFEFTREDFASKFELLNKSAT
jgi:hypothetical protein